MTSARGVPMASTAAVMVTEVELSAPIPDLVGSRDDGRVYRRAVVLARLHDVPLGLVEMALPIGGLQAHNVAEKLWSEVGGPAERHLESDGLDAPEHLGVGGLGLATVPACIRQREEFLCEPPRLTVIIPTRERPERLEQCIEGIFRKSTYPLDRYEVLVVDNAPTSSRTADVVAALTRRYPVRYLREDSPGSASARNTGLSSVNTDIVVFTDDDAIVDAHWLTTIARTFSSNPTQAP